MSKMTVDRGTQRPLTFARANRISMLITYSTETAVNECISEEALVHLKSYKYSSVDKSPVSNYILKHYVCSLRRWTYFANAYQWNAAVELLPLWLAPNMVTLLGFFFILINVGSLAIYIPDLIGPV